MPQNFLPPEQWFATLPTAYLSSFGLITDESGNVLIVDPNYRDHWTLPGGVVEEGEAPHVACEREVAEEVGLRLTPGPLLALHWSAPQGVRPKPFVAFIFDCGTVASDAEITLQEEELDAYAFVEPEEAARMLPAPISPRLEAALRARKAGNTVYVT
ncbi:NUDIX domain-containing protein [Nocardiopsis gilva YIM 90087]|uniref:NUDIX domain-containing protein n=1 Tax=Nocardiopsis gilva YIM 90087 TaxID=1235441 RepID=A0A223S7Z3_9ACTN|nr:NUDIX hydrolase [Nocardiopsis gilva]ASU84227.1 NUDIX domain-containing protein [Nocardiopsis gilva YIM 90087]